MNYLKNIWCKRYWFKGYWWKGGKREVVNGVGGGMIDLLTQPIFIIR